MGQYHAPVSIDRMEQLYPHPLGDGLKLMEFGLNGFGTMTALGLLLSGEGRWAGTRIAIIGDYAEADDLAHAGVQHADWLYTSRQNFLDYEDDCEGQAETADDHPIEITEVAIQMLVDGGFWTGAPQGEGWIDPPINENYVPSGPDCLVVNLDLQEAIDPAQLGDSRQVGAFITDSGGGAMTALAVALSCSNGRGGGDFRHFDETPRHGKGIVGRWSGDRIAIIPFAGSGEWKDLGPAYREAFAQENSYGWSYGTYEEGADGSIQRTSRFGAGVKSLRPDFVVSR